MFVDLIASTRIAETIGHQKYHLFLRDFYADITNAIEFNNGEIYQYVGDEVVLSWKLDKRGFTSDSFHCYFDMRSIIGKRESYYRLKYGCIPEFKAGLHYGKVIAGEIGIIKRDITFSGDVLNTASRIQGKCSEYGVNILTSDELLNLMPMEKFYNRISVGEVELKGKQAKMTLSTLMIAE